MAKVEIYTNGSCAYCVAAKTLLKQHGFDYSEIRVDAEPAQLQAMVERTQRRSVPQVLIDGQVIGGYEELAEAIRDGRLAPPAGGAA